MATKIGLKEVSVKGKKVTIRGRGGQALANGLVQKHTVTMSELAHKFGVIDPSELSIGNDGAVTISNESVATKVKAMAAGGDDGHWFDHNCSCRGD